jgi:hypothetical protein
MSATPPPPARSQRASKSKVRTGCVTCKYVISVFVLETLNHASIMVCPLANFLFDISGREQLSVYIDDMICNDMVTFLLIFGKQE